MSYVTSNTGSVSNAVASATELTDVESITCTTGRGHLIPASQLRESVR